MKRAAALAVLLATGGCMTGKLTHLHSDFQCRAPNGTCAPMSTIDAAVVAGMGATNVSASLTGGIAPEVARPLSYASGSGTSRTSDRVLKIVFPAYVDGTGTLHEESTAHAVVERGSWVRQLVGDAPGQGALPETAARAPLAGPSASDAGKLATLDEAIAATAKANLHGISAQSGGVVPAHTAVASTGPRIAGLAEAVSMAHADELEGLDPEAPPAADQSADPKADKPGVAHTRRVRWHGRWYRIPSRTRVVPQPGPASVAFARQVSLARDLNRSTLDALQARASVGRPTPVRSSTASSTAVVSSGGSLTAVSKVPLVTPSSVSLALPPLHPTHDTGVALDRVRAMAAPSIADHVRADLAAAREAGSGPLAGIDMLAHDAGAVLAVPR